MDPSNDAQTEDRLMIIIFDPIHTRYYKRPIGYIVKVDGERVGIIKKRCRGSGWSIRLAGVTWPPTPGSVGFHFGIKEFIQGGAPTIKEAKRKTRDALIKKGY